MGFNFQFTYRLWSLRTSSQSTGTGSTDLNTDGWVCTSGVSISNMWFVLSCRFTLIPLKVFPTHRGREEFPRRAVERETKGTTFCCDARVPETPGASVPHLSNRVSESDSLRVIVRRKLPDTHWELHHQRLRWWWWWWWFDDGGGDGEGMRVMMMRYWSW